MKFKYIIPAFIAVVAALFTGCSENNDPTYLSEIRVSQSYVGIPAAGGTVSVGLTASDSWTVKNVPAWLTVSPASGSAGFTNLTFNAGQASSTNEATVTIVCGNQTQEINVIQMTEKVELPISTCAEVVAGEDGKSFRVKGACTAIANTTYGNWYLNDGTEEVYIYGTLDAKGAEKNFLSLGIEVGDIITVEGPKTTYSGTVELVNVTVINIEKSLIKADSLVVNGVKGNVLPLEGGDFEAKLTNKGNGITVDIPADAQSWLSVLGIQNSGTTSTVKFRATANEGGDRKTTLVFKTTDGKKEYTTQAEVSQKGAVIACPIADFLAAEVGDTQYRLTGVITELYASDKQGKSFYIADHTGKTLIYRAEGFIEAGAKVGDVVTVVGKRGAYKETPQMVSGVFEAINYAAAPISIADFRNVADNKEAYYLISGTISEATEANTKNDVTQYGNFNLTDETGSVYVYGVLKGWGGAKGEFGDLGLTWGDKLTIIAYKTTYKGLVEAVGVYVSHEKAQ